MMGDPGNVAGLEIRLGWGLDGVMFGMSQQEVEALLGAPADRRCYEGEYWQLGYPDLGADLFFDAECGYRLASIEAPATARLSLLQCPLARYSRANVVEVMRERLRVARPDLADVVQLAVSTDAGAVSFQQLAISFHYDEGGDVAAVSWGPFFDREDRVVWPIALG